jgi:CIC family chloride channel protein
MVRFKPFQQFLGPKRIAIAEACVIGLVSGLAAVALKQSVEVLSAWRLDNPVPPWLLLPIVGVLGGVLSGWLVEQCAPEAGGSGIPQVKAVLGYSPMALNLRVALVKLTSTIVALGSGLSLGRQGPTVQIGAALAAQLSHWVPTSPEYRRQLISAGAAAGLAAGFNAPISGILFVVEELLQDFSGLTLGTAILASFVGAVVSRLLGGQGLNLSNFGMLQTGFSMQDLPFLILLGVLAGLLGGGFSQGILASLRFFRRMTHLSLPMRVGLAGFVTGVVGVILTISARDNTGLREFLVTGAASWQTIAIAFGSKFFLTLLAYGSGAPGGIFAPSLVLGSALGCLVSFLAQAVHGWVGLPMATLDSSNTTTYALTGMGAFFSASTRVPITAIVIVFEMTANFNLVLPLMIGSGVAYLISDRIAPGSLYNRLLAFQGVHLSPVVSDANPWANLTAADLMQRRVETLSATMSLKEALQAFSRSHHRGFPVLDEGRLVGIVTQTDLGDTAKASQGNLTLADLMTPRPVTVNPEASLSQVLYLLNRLKISRLPVVEGNRLVGIITRGDIIRAESEQISGQTTAAGPATAPSCGIYRTRSPATGQGRLLVPLSDPDTAPLLLRMAIAIAHQAQYEIECVHILIVSRTLLPDEAAVDTAPGKALLEVAEGLAAAHGIPIHTQIRVAHDVASALLEVVKKRHIDLVLMGWRRQSTTPGRVLGTIVDTLLRQAPCAVMLVRPGESSAFNRWLIPTAGGPNSQAALQWLPALITLGNTPTVRLFAVSASEEHQATLHQHLLTTATALEPKLNCPVKTRLVNSPNVAEAVAHISRQYRGDVVMMGASREGLFSHVLNGNIPLEIAQASRATLILVRQGGGG